MKFLLRGFIIALFCIFSFLPFCNASETLPTEDYLFSSFKETNSSQINAAAKKIQKKNYDGAEMSLSLIFDSYRDGSDFLLCEGEIELHKNNLDLAGVYFTKALDILTNPFALYSSDKNKYLIFNEIANIHILKGNYEKALEYSDKAMQSKTLEKEFIATRIKILSNYSIKDPKNIVKDDFFITDLEGIENYKDTAKDWQDILNILADMDKNIENSQFTWGKLFGISSKAKKEKEQQDKIKPLLPSMYVTKTELAYTLGYKDEALDLIPDLLYIASGTGNKKFYAKAYSIQAGILSKGYNKHAESIVAYTKALELDPTNYLYYLQRSWEYIKNKQPDFALADVDKCIELEPNRSIAYEYKANYLEYIGKRQQALDNYKKALKLNPNSKNAKDNILRIQGKIKTEAEEKASGIDAHTRNRLGVTDHLIKMMTGMGLIKKIQRGNNKIVNIYVDEKKWYGSSGNSADTLSVIEEYSYLRGYEIIDFYSGSTGKLLFRYHIPINEIPSN